MMIMVMATRIKVDEQLKHLAVLTLTLFDGDFGGLSGYYTVASMLLESQTLYCL